MTSFEALKKSHEHEVQTEGPRYALSTSATGKSNQAKMTGVNTEIKFLHCEHLHFLGKT